MAGLITQFASQMTHRDILGYSQYYTNGTLDGRITTQSAPHAFVYNIMFYGAVGDNSTDNTTAIADAIADIVTAGGGTLYVPEGIFLTNQISLAGASNINIVGGGSSSVLKLNASQASYLLISGNAENVRMHNLVFDGNETNQTGGFGIFQLTASVGPQHGFEVDHCIIQNSYHNGIRAVSGNDNTGVRLTNSLWKNCGRAAGHAINLEQSCPGAIIANNEIDTVTNSGGNGIFLANDSDYSRITGNYIHDIGDMGIEVWSNTTVGHVVVSNNTIENTGVTGQGYGISIDDTPHCACNGNTLRQVTGIGIEIVGSDYGAYTGNTIEDVGSIMFTGIIFNKSEYNTVTGNVIRGADGDSIRLYADTAGVGGNSNFNIVSGNTIISHASATGVTGIATQNNSATTSISHNIFENNIIIGNLATSSKGIEFTDSGSPGGHAGNIVRNNIIRNWVTGVEFQSNIDAGNQCVDNTYTLNTTDESISQAGTVYHSSGTGAPTVAVADGSTFHRTDGGASQGLYVRTNGAWEAK